MRYSKAVKVKNKRLHKKGKRQYLLKLFLSIFTLICVLPVLLVFIASFSSESSITNYGFSYFPKEWSVDAWRYIGTFKDQLINSYEVSIFETVVGTIMTLALTSMFGYVLTKKDFCLNKFLTIFLVTTMFVNSGPLAGYVINANVYHLRNNLLVLILPGCVTVFNVVIMRTFIQSNIPDSLMESAKIDGCGMGRELFQFILPLIWPTISTLIVLSCTGIISAGGGIVMLLQPDTQYGTSTLYYWMFRKVYGSGTGSGDYGVVSAMGLCFTLLVVPFTLLVRKLLDKVPTVEY